MDALTGPEYNLLPVYAAGPAIGPVRPGASYVSASRATRVGGDLYKAVPSPYGVRLVIADVQGKGLGTMRCAAVVPAAFRESGPEAEELAEVGSRIESALNRPTDGQRFVNGILAQIGPDGQFLAFNHGHPAPLLRTADGGIRFVEPDEPIPERSPTTTPPCSSWSSPRGPSHRMAHHLVAEVESGSS
ncbi:SpoIIE family protein phosphatase [Streptomyces parvus]|uniref:PP2C family protein-serine/threonine phosphatase n=1 Tax=Streptomyces parvus TaxID=66428 RepID=UPI0033BC0CEC